MTRSRNAVRLASYWAAGTPARQVEEPEPVAVEEATPPEPGRPDELRYGYTMAEVQRLAQSAAANNHTMAADHRDLVHAAWSAIIDLLYTTEQPPTRHDLATAGRAGIWRLVKDHRQTYGYRDRDPYNGIGSAPHFAAYWQAPAEPPHEERFVEQIAVWQVFNALTDRQREVLLAAAAHDGDYLAAAESLGMPRGSYTAWLSQARRAATAWWHTPETPRQVPGRRGTFNRRVHRGEVAPHGTVSAVHRHEARGERMCDLCAPVRTVYDRDRRNRRKERNALATAGERAA
jgi:DNA-directed RNA polymerase specialized sigma24 family protein